MRRPFVISAVVLLLASVAHAQNNCAAVLGSVFDRTNLKSYYVASHSFENFFCQNTFSSESQARDAGASVGIPIDGLPLQIGGHFRSNDWSAYQSQLCHIITSNSTVDATTFLQLEQVNANVIQAWSKCVESDQAGLSFYAEVDDDARTVAFTARFRGITDDAASTKLRSKPLVLSDAAALNCTNSFPSKIGNAPQTVICRRADDANGALTAALQTKSAGSPKVSIPAVHPKVFPPPLCVHPTLLSRGAAVDASLRQNEAAAVTDGQINPGNWNSLAGPPQFVIIHLPQRSTVTHIGLNPEQTPPGHTVHVVSAQRLGANGTDEEIVLGTLDGNTISGGVVTLTLPEQVRGIGSVKVLTVVSPSAVSWREIEVFGCPN